MDISSILQQAEGVALRKSAELNALEYLSLITAARFFERVAQCPSGEYEPATAAMLANDAYREAGVPDSVYVPRS